jgi:hypothetical protein
MNKPRAFVVSERVLGSGGGACQKGILAYAAVMAGAGFYFVFS